MKKESIFLLNPPSEKLILRDYYCCTYSKTGYLWHPVDLLVQSGMLAKNFNVVVFDAVALRAGDADVLRAAEECGARTVFSLIGSKSENSDVKLLAEIKKGTGAKIAVSGDIALSDTAGLFTKWPWLDAVVTDFVSNGLEQFAAGVAGPLPGLTRKDNTGAAPASAAQANSEFAYPLPLHELFISDRYSMPYARAPFATVLTEFGCPFRCAFCNSGESSIGFRRRNLENVEEELMRVKDLGARHIFFKDMTFGTSRERSRELCDFFVENLPGVTWHSYTRAHLLDEETIKLYAASGCVLLQIGVETANPEVAEAMGKKQSAASIKTVFALLKKHGVASGSHYILGLPGEGAAKTLNTIFSSLRLGADYASFNFFTPRPGSELYGETLSPRTNKPLWKFMMRLAYLLFYMRPAYIARRLSPRGSGGSGSLKSLANLAGYLRRLPDLSNNQR